MTCVEALCILAGLFQPFYEESPMFKVNEYFDGTVKSIAFGTAEGPATIGVMAPGDTSSERPSGRSCTWSPAP